MYDLVLRRARLLDRPELCDVAVTAGRVTACGARLASGDTRASGPAPASGAAREVDIDGRLLLPGFVDSHIHLDKAFLWQSPLIHGKTGPQFFSALREFKRRAERPEIKSRMHRALELASRHGTIAIRAQIDIDDMVGLAGLEAALELRAEWARWLDLQLVAFPQEGLLARPGLMDLLREALAMGADVIGGGPSFDAVPAAEHLAAVFALAREYDRDVDLHVDLATPASRPAAEWELAEVARLTTASGWQGRVTVAHLRGLGAMTPEQAEPLLAIIRDAAIRVTVVPGAELHTARAWWDPPVRDITRAMTNVERLLRAGVNLSYSTGHICDPWNPLGTADMLEDAFLLAAAYNLGEPSIAGVPILRLATVEPWLAMRLPGPPDITVGRRADLVVLDAADADAAVRHQASRIYTFKSGTEVVRTEETQHAAWTH
ncbi:MAG TPA: amidohydrolase family protein [bacterium]|nr:amidohydrolase family protein [bacterium]